MENNEREALILGALLHDIGKFVQRAQDKPKSKHHTEWGIEWFEQKDGLREKPRLAEIFSNEELNIISSAINSHHNGIEYLSLADAISAGMDRIPLDKEEKGDPSTARLISVFSRISISTSNIQNKYYQLVPLSNSLEEIFPVKNERASASEYRNLLDRFNEEIRQLNFQGTSIHKAINTIYFRLWKYTWSIPSAAYEDEPDISLFDHLKTTAAIAPCLYDYKKENPDRPLDIGTTSFQLVAGDISGIQNYILTPIYQQGKVSKRLRARSFYIQILSEIITHKIIHIFNLSLANIISSAGGNFIILLPNLKNTNDKLENLQKELDHWAYNNLKGELYVTLANTPATGRDIIEYTLLLEKLKDKQQSKKNKPFYSILLTNGQWNNNFVLNEVIESDETICSSCHKHPAVKENEEQDKLCEWCLWDEKIGKQLPYTKYIAFFSKTTNDSYPSFNYSFMLHNTLPQNNDAYLILTLNDTSNIDTGFKFIANYIPTVNDINCPISEHDHSESKVLLFDCIAENSEGDHLIGYVKADVDNMGSILKNGFQRTKLSVSRFIYLSRMLETFFAGYLQKKLESNFKDIYTVFSGGDDFFVIGPWNRTIEFAKTMREEFSRFTGEHPDFTFSAGIFFAKPQYPISFSTEEVEKLLKQSKSFEGKDRITLFSQSIKWELLNESLNESNNLIKWYPSIISRGLIYNLKKYSEMAEKFCKTKNTKYLKFVPLLVYDINRNLNRKDQQEPKQWCIEKYMKEVLPVIQEKYTKGLDNLSFLRIVIEYVLLYTRRD